ncbi:cx9C motif-containing protein 4 [Dendropsophus ebraccatus]|uniref:cx9C motif-containing protein 4 n=1 Tax=Dendropsophus ebraccatus TaxID=150705 RepID=UPI00383184AA
MFAFQDMKKCPSGRRHFGEVSRIQESSIWSTRKWRPALLKVTDLMPQRKDPCQKAACAIQKCLQLNNYMEKKCEQEIEAMRLCCSKLRTQESICCSGFQDRQASKENPKGSSSTDQSLLQASTLYVTDI